MTSSEAPASLPTFPPSNVVDLLARVKERGFVTTGEIFAALPDLEPETDELAAIYAWIRASGVEVVDEIAEELQREDERHAGRPAAPDRDRARGAAHRRVGAAVARARPPVVEAPTRATPARCGPTAWRAAASTRCACTSRRSARSRCSPPSRR